MFEAEASWLEELLREHPPARISPLLNLGSSTRAFREIDQPWCEARLFAPLRARGIRVIHVDAREGDGIDIRADLLDPAQTPRLKAQRPRAILCCNMLEHVSEPRALARACIDIAGPGGLIFVTVPYSYPFHRDPIDTMFRPTPDDLALLFAPATMIVGEILDAGISYRAQIGARPWLLLRPLLRFPFPFIGFAGWKRSLQKLYWLFNNYRITGAVFEVPPLKNDTA